MWDLAKRSVVNESIRRDSRGSAGNSCVHWTEDPRAALASVITTFLTPTWWMTLTFRRPETTTLIAMSSLRCWLSQWANAARCEWESPRGQPPISRLVWCVELQQRGTAHIHALGEQQGEITGPHCKRCFQASGWRQNWYQWKLLKDAWWNHHGIARIYPYDASRAGGVAGYVAKYMYKSQSEWGLWEHGKDF